MIKNISRFMAKTTIYHGLGSRELVGREAAKLGFSKALLVCDPGIQRAGLLGDVEKKLSQSGVAYEIYDEIEEDPDVNTVHALALIMRESGCDGVVAVGGGSAMCAAKGAALEATNDVGSIRELEGINEYKAPPLPVICLPTTAGSGTEVSWGFPVVDKEAGREFSIAGEHIQPPVSLLDPYFLRTCPRTAIIYAGLDALCHGVEALWGTRATVLTDALAYEAIRLIMKNLRMAVLTDDMDAKSHQLLGSTMANLAGGNAGLGIIHGIAVSVGNLRGPHGFKCGMLLPHAIEFNMPVCQGKFAKMAKILSGTPQDEDTSDLAAVFLQQIKQLLVDLDFPRRFRPENLQREKIPGLIGEVRKHIPPFLETNLRPVTDDDIARICEAALKGWE